MSIGEPGRVLVVDDEASVRWSLSVFLEDSGFEVTEAVTAEEALQLLERSTFDVAIVDLRLPGMTGEQLILEAHSRYRTLRYLIHTGIKEYELPPELLTIGLGPEHVLHKPQADLGRFVTVIRDLMEPWQRSGNCKIEAKPPPAQSGSGDGDGDGDG